MKTFYIKALNTCIMRRQNVNTYRNFFIKSGLCQVSTPHDADFILVWTCSFRADVRDISLSVINKYILEHSGSTIIIAGCMPDIYPETLKDMPSNVIILPWKKEYLLYKIIESNKMFDDDIYVEKSITEDINEYKIKCPTENIMFCDQFIKVVVSQGCNCKCTYCSERLAFPPYRSHKMNDIVENCRRVVLKQNVFDIALMADSLGEYGVDLGTNLVTLMHSLCEIHPSIKIVLNNFHPKFFVQNYSEFKFFFDKMKIRHINLPIQSASNKILKLMKRDYTKAEISSIFDLFNSIDFKFFDTHIIVGFPGENIEDLEETLEFLIEKKPAYVLASAYMESPDSGSAMLLNKISQEEKLLRLNKVQKLLQNSGIIVNSDGSVLAQERLSRILACN